MKNKKSEKTFSPKLPTRQELILAEKEIIIELRKMMQDPRLSLNERLRASSVLAYHMNVPNRMLPGEEKTDEFEEENLGHFVRSVEPRIYSRLRREYRIWKRMLTYRKR